MCSKSIANFEFPRIFDFRFFCGVMLVLMFFIYADKYGHFECSVNFNFLQQRCLHVFWLVFDFCLFQKIDQRICVKFYVKNKIKDAFRMLTVAYGEDTLAEATFIGDTKCSPRAEKM